MRLIEDTDLFLRMARTFGAYFMDRTTLHYRIGSPSLMHSPNPPPEQRAAELEGDRHLRAKNRRDHSMLEFFVLRVAARLFLRIARCRVSHPFPPPPDGQSVRASWPSG